MTPRAPWVKVEPSKYAKVHQVDCGRSQPYRAVTSPFDIPQAIRGYVTKRNILEIELKYLTEERTESVSGELAGFPATFLLGLNSRRLKRIEVDLGKALFNEPSDFGNLLKEIVSTISREPAQFASPEVASQVVFDNSERFTFDTL